ncbi:hypothetical protein DLJ47_01485 [Micromonospora sp. S4605]|uniref:hypothetical protein n=1 Tax=Micromonospora sp. S4605 TaxID=1420897 RepID=UPI000D6FE648|nr:hypothetical protein [Micromonospora sp. S4605]PWU57789.1 hypothetical protein DLJ47_01485 [Micromonospora sp. S4605]
MDQTRDETGWLGGWVRADPVRAVGVVMVLVSLVWRAQLASRGHLAVDDWVLISRASEADLTPDFLLTLYNNHFMPAALLSTWLVTRAVGVAYWPYVLLLAAAQTVLAVSFFRLLRTLVRPGWAMLIPLAVFLFSPLTLEATSWWAVGVNMLPMQIAMVLAVGAQVRYVRTGRRRHLLSLAAAVLFGLLFFEKALLVVPLVFLATACLLVGGPPVRAVLTTVRRYWPSWAMLTALSLGFLALYLSRAESSLRRPDSLTEVLSFLGQLLGSTVVPGLLGGPWRWLPAGDGAPVTAPPELARWLAWAVFLTLVVVTVRLRRTAGRAWVLLAAYLTLVTAMLGATRLGSIYSDVAGAVPRYVSDVVVVAALCLGVALLGLATPTPSTADGPTTPGDAARDPELTEADPAAARAAMAPPAGTAGLDQPATHRHGGVIHAEAADDEVTQPGRPFATPPATPTSTTPGPVGPVGPVGPTAATSGGTEPAIQRYPAAGDGDSLRAQLARHRETVSTVLTIVVLAGGLGAAWTTARFGDEWAVKSGKVYLETARVELAAAPPDTVFFDRPVPPEVVPALSAPYNRQSKFFQAMGDAPVFVTEAEAPSLFDASGRIVPVSVDGPAVVPGPEDGCGYKITGGRTVRMPLTAPRDDWFWVVRIGYLSSADTTATFRLGSATREFPVRQGLHQYFFEFTGGGDAVELTVNGYGVTLCTNEVAVGTPTPQQ